MIGARFPYSEIFGSKRACRSPKLIAACCVLRRLMKPRHPSIAVTGLCKRSNIQGVYLTHLHFYPELSKNKNIQFQNIVPRLLPNPEFAECEMVGPDGLEPSTPRLSSACSNQLSYEPKIGKWQSTNGISLFGGAGRIRTGDVLLAKQVLYQLSYDPLLVE